MGPLAGYRVLEFAANLTAPVATMLMGDQGADVIKVEPEQGDQVRRAGASRAGVDLMGAVFLNANRNKRSIVLDLKNQEHLDAARRIAAQCDVVVQNYRPSVADRMGIGYEDLRVLRNDIIYISVNGLGATGPDANRRVYDIVVQGMAGFAGAQADPITGEPQIVRNAIVDKTTALTIWQAATAGLLHRERTGEGQHIQVSMLKTALTLLWPDAMSNATLQGEGVRAGATMSSIRYVYRTNDGYILVGFVSDAEWAGVCRAMEQPELIEDPRFRTIQMRSVNAEALNVLMAEAISKKDSAHWLAALRREDAIFAPINAPGDVINDPQIRDIGAIREHAHPLVGRYVQPGHPIEFGAAPALPHRHAPELGADGADILQEFGLDPALLMRPPQQD